MKVLVTGATGFVGSHVVDELLKRGIQTAYIARATSNHKWLEGKDVELVEGSLNNLESLKKAVRDIDVIIHVAGSTAAKNEKGFRAGNEGATRNLIDAVRAYRPGLQRFVHISSLAVTGPAKDADHPVMETSQCHPLTAYGRTKLLAEHVITEVMDEIPCTIVRPPAVFGPRDPATLTFFQAVNKGIAPLIGFDDKQVSLVHVRDLARGIVDAALSENTIGKTYFIGSDIAYTWKQIAAVTAKVTGRKSVRTLKLPHGIVLGIAGVSGFFGKMMSKPPVLDYEKGIDMIQGYWVCSSAEAAKDFGYRQNIPLEEGVLDTVTWYREQGWL